MEHRLSSKKTFKPLSSPRCPCAPNQVQPFVAYPASTAFFMMLKRKFPSAYPSSPPSAQHPNVHATPNNAKASQTQLYAQNPASAHTEDRLVYLLSVSLTFLFPKSLLVTLLLLRFALGRSRGSHVSAERDWKNTKLTK